MPFSITDLTLLLRANVHPDSSIGDVLNLRSTKGLKQGEKNNHICPSESTTPGSEKGKTVGREVIWGWGVPCRHSDGWGQKRGSEARREGGRREG